MEVASYFSESFSLVFINFNFQLHNATQVNIMSSTCCDWHLHCNCYGVAVRDKQANKFA